MRRLALAVAMITVLASPAAAQLGGRLSVAPYLGYGFFGNLGDSGVKLNEALAYGARGSVQLTPQFALFGNVQRSSPHAAGFTRTHTVTVDQWSAGVEFAYVPRGGAEGMLPILLEAGAGRVHYDFSEALGQPPRVTDLAVNLGLSSALQLSPNFGVRYGINDYISNYRGDRGIVNQVFARVGAEVTF